MQTKAERRRPGSPKGNQNARKAEHKQYVRYFGQRWSPEEAEIIERVLALTGLREKEYLMERLWPLLQRESAAWKP